MVNIILETSKSDYKGHTYLQWITAVLAGSTLLTYGLQGGWISPMIPLLKSDQSPTGRPLSDIEISWVASSMSIAAMFGVPFYAYIADTFGRKAGILGMVISQALCWIIKLTTSNTTALIIARICAGLPSGGCFNIIPMYIKEISQDSIRGILVSSAMLFQSMGTLAMYAMGGYLDYHLILKIALCVPIVTFIFIWFVPESPAFLVKQNKIEQAIKNIAFLRGLNIEDKVIETAINELKNEEMSYRNNNTISFFGIFKNKAWRRAFVLCFLLLSAMDLNGNFSIVSYAWSIVKDSGATINPELQTLSIPVVMIAGSLVSLGCVEKFGRKPLMVSTFVMTTLGTSCLATAMLCKSLGIWVPSWLPIVCIITTVFACAAGVMPIVYVVMAEIFNFQIRAKLISCLVVCGWFLTFVQLAIFGVISSNFGMYTMFYMYTAVNVGGVLVSIFMLPETKGKSVEQIEKMLLAK